jgi:hypothetical protein
MVKLILTQSPRSKAGEGGEAESKIKCGRFFSTESHKNLLAILPGGFFLQSIWLLINLQRAGYEYLDSLL